MKDDSENTMGHLRDSLFEVLRRVMDDKNPMDPKQAQAAVQTADKIIDIAKVELRLYEETGYLASPDGGILLEPPTQQQRRLANN